MSAPDERDPRWVAHLAAREAHLRAAARRRELTAIARARIAADAELARLHTRATIPDLTALRDARIGDWRADLDAQITRDPSTGAWTTRADVHASRRSA